MFISGTNNLTRFRNFILLVLKSYDKVKKEPNFTLLAEEALELQRTLMLVKKN